MKFSWKKIGKGAIKGLSIAAEIDPIHFGPFIPLIAMADKLSGTNEEKKAAVMEALEAEIAQLPADKQDEARAAYSEVVDAIVAIRKAQAKAQSAYDKTAALIAAAKA